MRKVILISILLVLGLVFGALVGKAQLSVPQEQQKVAEPEQIPLRNYQNEEFDYALSYPANWNLWVSSESPVGHIKLTSENIETQGNDIVGGDMLEVYVIPKQGRESLETWLSEKDEQNSDIPVLSEEPYSQDGFSGIRRTVGTLGNADNPSFDIFLDAGNRIYELAGFENAFSEMELENIISSFQILEDN